MYRSFYPHRFDMPLRLSMTVSNDPTVSGVLSGLTPAQREELAGRLASYRTDISDCCGGELFHTLRPTFEHGGYK